MSSAHVVPLGQPLHGASFGIAVKRYFRGYVGFSGRASRSEYWWTFLFTFLVGLVVGAPYIVAWSMFAAQVFAGDDLDGLAPGASLASTGALMAACLVLLLLVNLALLLPSLAVMWRRLQDANFHGAFSLFALAGLGIVPLIMCFFESNPEGIRFDRPQG